MFETQIEFRNLDHSDFVEGAVRERLKRLDRFADDIMRCRVTVEAPHKHQGKGHIYHISIACHLPGKEIIVNNDPGRNLAHEDIYVAIRDAVNAAARQIEDYVRLRRGKVKSHEAPPHGTVSELNAEQGYGRIATPEGRSIYFHRNSLIDARLEDLTVGTEVRFDEEDGDEGPQATTVHVIGKHHIVS